MKNECFRGIFLRKFNLHLMILFGISCCQYGNIGSDVLFLKIENVMFNRKGGNTLKISINIDENVTDTEISISCARLTPEIEKILATLRILDRKLMVEKKDESYILDVSEIVYMESIDRKTFVYTKDDYFESKLKLYELEEQFCECGFFRASKSCIVQLKYIKSLKADINRRIRLTLENGEQIIVSRQYAEELKRKLGVV